MNTRKLVILFFLIIIVASELQAQTINIKFNGKMLQFKDKNDFENTIQKLEEDYKIRVNSFIEKYRKAGKTDTEIDSLAYFVFDIYEPLKKFEKEKQGFHSFLSQTIEFEKSINKLDKIPDDFGLHFNPSISIYIKSVLNHKQEVQIENEIVNFAIAPKISQTCSGGFLNDKLLSITNTTRAYVGLSLNNDAVYHWINAYTKPQRKIAGLWLNSITVFTQSTLKTGYVFNSQCQTKLPYTQVFDQGNGPTSKSRHFINYNWITAIENSGSIKSAHAIPSWNIVHNLSN